MADTVRTTVYLSTEAAELLTQRAGPRGRGEYLSELILRDRGPLQFGQGVFERMSETMDQMAEGIERMERTLAAMDNG